MNYTEIIVAALAMFALGAIWYGPLFGKRWMAFEGVKKGKKKEPMGWRYALSLAQSLVTAFVLSYFIELIGAPHITGGIQVGFWAWLGFYATTSLGKVLWENKPWGLWVLNNGYNLLGLMLMGAIIGAL